MEDRRRKILKNKTGTLLIPELTKSHYAKKVVKRHANGLVKEVEIFNIVVVFICERTFICDSYRNVDITLIFKIIMNDMMLSLPSLLHWSRRSVCMCACIRVSVVNLFFNAVRHHRKYHTSLVCNNKPKTSTTTTTSFRNRAAATLAYIHIYYRLSHVSLIHHFNSLKFCISLSSTELSA